MTRIVTIGTGIQSCRAALRGSPRKTTVFMRRSASLRTRRAPRKLGGWTSLASFSLIPRPSRLGRPGLDTVRGGATPREQRRLFDAQLELAAELSLPVVIHNREADSQVARCA